MKNGRTIGGIQIGTCFLVLIFVVLALVIFSVLSLLSALSDDRLAERNMASVQAFYAADATGEEQLRKIDENISQAADAGGSAGFSEELEVRLGDLYQPQQGIVSYSVEISQDLGLFVDLAVSYEKGEDGRRYSILRWQVENVGEYEIDDSLNLWDGGQ